MSEVFQILIAPPGAICDLCECSCAGEPCEATVIDGRERYSHVDLERCLERWEASEHE